MTEKQIRFCEEYVIDLDPVRAYKAVYKNCRSERSAATAAGRLLTNVDILTRVRELQQEVAQKAMISAEEVVRDLITIKNRCMQAEPVKVWNKELHTYVDSEAEYTFDSKGATAALKLLGDHLGMFQKKIEVSADEDTLKAAREMLGGIDSAIE